jgi:hypothetical protein
MRKFDTVWSFETAKLIVELQFAPCDEDPRDSFEDEEAIEKINDGTYYWFDSRIRIKAKSGGAVLATDYLGGSAYSDATEFYTAHRDRDPLNRNCTIMRAAKGENVCICHYFPGMVAEACKEARATLLAFPHLRTAA